MLTRRLPFQLRRGYSNAITSPFGRVELPSGTVDQYTMELWSKWEDKTAIECGVTGRSFTYRQLRKRSKSFGCGLAQLGMAGKTALIVLHNYPEYPVALLGALQAGMTVSTANPSYTPRELESQATDSGADCLVTEPGCLERVLEAVAGRGLPVICTGQDTREGVISFEELSTKEFPDVSLLPTQREKEEQLAMLPYSSGTTGLPKGVRLLHRNITANIAAMSHPSFNYIMDTTESHQDAIPAVVPFFHIYGSTASMLRALRLGARIISMPRFESGSFIQILAKNKDIVLHAVPPIIHFLGSHPQVKPKVLDGLRFTMTGAAPCSPADIARVQEKKPHPIVQESHQDAIPAVVPFFHIYGSTASMLRALRLGARIISMPRFESGSFIQILAKNKDIVLHAVPPIIHFLGSHPQVKPKVLDGLRFTMTGAAPCSPADIARVQEKKPHPIVQGYGMTEAGGMLTSPPLGAADTTTIGVAIPGISARVVDPDTECALGPGLKGELCFKGPQVMEGYHNNPKATADTLDSDGWLRTGDLGYADEGGNFFVVDRLKELIKVKGYQVAPAELEALLRQHPKVAEAGVTSATCPRSGEVPVAFLVPVPGSSIDPDQVTAWLRDLVAPYKRPAKVITVDQIPKSPSGKILRRTLKEIVQVEVKTD